MPRQKANDDILLIVMRHGEAESLRVDDKSRQLTEFGRRQVTESAKWLTDKHCTDHHIDFALVSPYRRARQTFDMVGLDVTVAKTEICEDIVPEGNPRLAHDYVDSLLSAYQSRSTPINTLLVVSHMPFVSYFLDEICPVKTNSLFATASMAVVKYNVVAQRGELLVHFQGGF